MVVADYYVSGFQVTSSGLGLSPSPNFLYWGLYSDLDLHQHRRGSSPGGDGPAYSLCGGFLFLIPGDH